MNSVEKTQNAVITVKKRLFNKVLAVICSASLAMSAVAVNAFAESGTSSIDMYDSIAESFKTGIQDCVDGVVKIIAAGVPIAIGIIGLYAAIGAGKKIFTKLVG